MLAVRLANPGKYHYFSPPGVLGEGLENADLLLATNAGKPLLLTGERHDYFDREHCPEATDWRAPSCHATTCPDL